MFIIGVRNQGSILIDDVTIRPCEMEPPGWGLPVKPGTTDLLKRKAELDRLRAQENLAPALRDMLVVWCNEGAGDKIISAREQYARELSPDFVDWHPCGPLAKDFGVRTSSGGPEYQEFYKFEGPDIWQSRIEEVIGVKDRIPNWSRVYKMGRAGGHETKPVWVRGPVYDECEDRAPQLSPLFWETHFAEALASGGVRDISFGMNAPWTGDPATLDFIDSPELQQVWKRYSRMCGDNRALFANRKSLARVALIYSLPSTMFRRYYPLGIDDDSRFSAFDQAAKWLDSEHIPFDCVVFGHPEVFTTEIEQLKRCDVLLLPSADALSDVQISFLKTFTARGGKVIKSGEIGTLDENLNPRPTGGALVGLEMLDLSDKPRALDALKKA